MGEVFHDMVARLGRFLRRRRSLVSLVRRLSVPDYIEPIRRMMYSEHVIEKVVGVHRFKMSIDNPVSEEWYEREEISRNTEFFVDSLVNRGDVVVDAGAHNGFYTLLSALCVGEEGAVYAFEALPSNYMTLMKNVEMNKLVNVRPFNLAVGGQRESVRFNKFNDGIISAHGQLIVEMVPLRDVVDTKIDVLKVDVEGAECQVLEGARSLITPSTKIMCEVHPEQLGNFGRSTSDVIELLSSFGGGVSYWHDGALRPVEEGRDAIARQKSFVFRLPEGWTP
jgi:FkbM family methyltransferase